jgi:carboxylate-amine ligase
VRIDFHGSPEPTLGVEWEFALVDRRTRDLRNDATHLFARAKPRLPDPGKLHKELLRNTVEVVSGVCRTAGEAIADLRSTLEVVLPAGDDLDLDLYGGGTHPFASWTAQQLSEGHRYEELINRTQWWGRQMLIWGVHVHVGLPEQERVMGVLSSLLNTTTRTCWRCRRPRRSGRASTPATRRTGP